MTRRTREILTAGLATVIVVSLLWSVRNLILSIAWERRLSPDDRLLLSLGERILIASSMWAERFSLILFLIALLEGRVYLYFLPPLNGDALPHPGASAILSATAKSSAATWGALAVLGAVVLVLTNPTDAFLSGFVGLVFFVGAFGVFAPAAVITRYVTRPRSPSSEEA